MTEGTRHRWSFGLAAVIALGLPIFSARPPVQVGESIPAPARLVAFARLPADTFAAGPASGAFLPAGRRTAPAFEGQPVQGISSIHPWTGDEEGWWYALTDNGFGSKLNSPDYLLRLYRVRPRWRTVEEGDGSVDVAPAFIALRDPDRHVPFRLVNETTGERMLTGADFDPESLAALADGTFWIGDEFGPFLLHVAPDGRLLEPPFELAGLRSPDHPLLAPADAGQASGATTPRSRGFEGLAASADGRFLYAAQESTALDAATTRIHEFAVEERRFTGRAWDYPFEAPGHMLTDLVAAGDGFLAVERDDGHGPAAGFKRVFRVVPAADGTTALAKTPIVDLLRLADPDGLAGPAGPFTFPFVTTEAVWPLADGTLVLVNDNNYPATGGRTVGVRDGSEFIRLRLQP